MTYPPNNTRHEECPNNAKTVTAGNQSNSRILLKLWLTFMYLVKKDIPAFDYTLGLWFSEKMNFLLAFPVAIFVILFTANCADSEKDCSISDSDTIKAATDAMKNCNSNIKHCFDAHEGKSVAKLYCKGMMVRFLCPLSAALIFNSLFFVVVPWGGGIFPHHLLTPSPLYISFVFGNNRKGSQHWLI